MMGAQGIDVVFRKMTCFSALYRRYRATSVVANDNNAMEMRLAA